MREVNPDYYLESWAGEDVRRSGGGSLPAEASLSLSLSFGLCSMAASFRKSFGSSSFLCFLFPNCFLLLGLSLVCSLCVDQFRCIVGAFLLIMVWVLGLILSGFQGVC